jgi:hypothetical protein
LADLLNVLTKNLLLLFLCLHAPQNLIAIKQTHSSSLYSL